MLRSRLNLGWYITHVCALIIIWNFTILEVRKKVNCAINNCDCAEGQLFYLQPNK